MMTEISHLFWPSPPSHTHILHLFSFPCFISFTGCGPWRRVRHIPQRTTWHPATDSLMLAHTEQGQVFYSCEILVFLDLMMSVSMTSLWGHGWNGWYWKVWLADSLLFLELPSQLITRNFRLSSNLTAGGRTSTALLLTTERPGRSAGLWTSSTNFFLPAEISNTGWLSV